MHASRTPKQLSAINQQSLLHAVEPRFRLDQGADIDASMIGTITRIVARRIRLADARLVRNTGSAQLLGDNFIAIAVVLTQRCLAQPEV